jgi:hypothetical protein
MASVPITQAPESVEQKFQRLAATWRTETGHLSSVTNMFNHPAYQKIIGLGPEVLPSLFRDLQRAGALVRSAAGHYRCSACTSLGPWTN